MAVKKKKHEITFALTTQERDEMKAKEWILFVIVRERVREREIRQCEYVQCIHKFIWYANFVAFNTTLRYATPPTTTYAQKDEWLESEQVVKRHEEKEAHTQYFAIWCS